MRRDDRLASPGWVVLGFAQLLAAAVGLFLWVIVTTTFSTNGLSRDWVAGGVGIVVAVYAGVMAFAGARLILRRWSAWLGWVELTTVPLLLLIAISALQGAFGGGAVLFYLPMAGVVAALAVVATAACVALLRQTRQQG
jgi:hypothetical protein